MLPNADLVTFIEQILNGKLHFCAVLFPLHATTVIKTASENS